MSLHRTLLIELVDDCVFSERSATEGEHETLTRIPGSALLGAAASVLYPGMLAGNAPEQAYAAFHSGRLRFGDGLPEAAPGRPAWPVPLAWHQRKGEKVAHGTSGSETLDASRVFNFLHVQSIVQRDGEGQAQPKQLRDAYVGEDGRWIRPRVHYRTKTAISSLTGRAESARLFGYSALARGQRFVAKLDADDGFDPALFNAVCEVLKGNILLGRSRSAEYGRARVEVRDAGAEGLARCDEGRTLTLWLLSDLAPCDAAGDASFALEPAALGLPDGSRIDWERTFLRSRRYSPWNAARHGYDAERQVYTAGGVIRVELSANAEVAEIASHLSRGIGLHREAGLGAVWVNSALLAAADLDTTFSLGRGATRGATPTPTPVRRPAHPLLDWLATQPVERRTAAESRARALAARYVSRIEAARKVYGYPDAARDFHPSRAQWGGVLEAARFNDAAALYAALFKHDGAVIKPTGKGWSLELPPEGKGEAWIRLADWLCAEMDSQDRAGTVDALFAQQLARMLMDSRERRQD